MSYDTVEASVDSGTPYFLYLFDDGTTKTRFTSEADDVSADPEALGSDQAWAASAIEHSNIVQTGELEKSNLDISFPLSDSFALGYLAAPAASITTVTVWRAHRGTTEYRVIWKGRIASATPKGLKIVISVESIFTSLRRSGCRRRYQHNCPFVLYGQGCGLTRSDFESSGTVSAVTGLVLTISEAASAPAGDFTGGIVNYGGVLAWITNHNGDQITIKSDISGLADYVTAHGSASVELSPGCNLSSARCNSRFSNLANFGGYEFMPSKNPFTSAFV